MRGRAGVAWALLVVLVAFATNSVATRYVVSRDLLDPATTTLVRFAAGAAMLVAVLAAQGRVRDAMPRRRDVAPAFFLGVYALLIAYGYVHITAAAGTFVFYALVVATMAAGGALAGAPPGRWAVVGAVSGLSGVALLAYGRVAGSTPLGVLLLAGTGAAWGAYSLLLRGRGDAVGSNARAFVAFALALPVLALVEADALVVTPWGLVVGIVMGAGTTALAYALWARILPLLGRTEAGVHQLLVPILTSAMGIAALGEPLSWRLVLAGGLVVAGMALATVRR